VKNSNTIGKILLLSLALILLFSAALGCGGTTTENKNKLFIWKVSSESTYVYLFGYVPVSDNTTYPLDSVIENAFITADNFVLYTNFKNTDQEVVSQYVIDHGKYTGGDKLSNHLSQDLQDKFVTFSDNMGIGDSLITLYDNYRPWVVYNIMSQLMLNYLGYDSNLGMDTYFLDKAEKTNKNIIELETTIYQLDLLSSIPDEIMIKMMEYDVDNPLTGQDITDIIAAWKAGDPVKMENAVFKARKEISGIEPYYTTLYDERNVNIVSKIEKYLTGDDTYFILVSAGLFVGQNGLLNLLTSKGYTVEQLTSDK
jgi:uncharacterized protein YbaP (TraB family)